MEPVSDLADEAVPGDGAPGPESVAWRYVGDWRLLFGVGRALVLQVAHPVVGAGVTQHSDLRSDPWRRFNHTLESLMIQVYGGEAATSEARRLRDRHRSINGVDGRGRQYRALGPEAYWWVHATIFESVLADHDRFGRALSAADQVRFYKEWKALGRLLGVPGSQIPPDLAAFWSYYEGMLTDRLEDNQAVRDVLDAITGHGTPPPPGWRAPAAAWRPVSSALGKVMYRVTVGMLPPALRRRLDLAWTASDERGLSALGAVVRTAFPALPPRWRYHPVAADTIRRGWPGRSPQRPRATGTVAM